MKVDQAIESSEDAKHEPGFPCPACHVITVRQPWASLIALGFKHMEFRTRRCHFKGPVVIHAAKNWYSAALLEIVWKHMSNYTEKPKEALQALFPCSLPVANAVVEDCKQWTDDSYAISLGQVRIVTWPKPAFNGMLGVPWKTSLTTELASALARSRVLEGQEKDGVYKEFELLALRNKINDWLKSEKLAHFALTPSR